ncbi:hypothetical protein [Marinilactibacillus sp. Marseille-P9653]|uniref:DUF7309 domain-containing protein n=1 Tax=Marinilactibacillus sp. Marseille-P9653 TaxID=2866583 RepID=UPI001CE43216|nr:hypothetical protein [Marinilactibacillus sp. Marseille-P9653]
MRFHGTNKLLATLKKSAKLSGKDGFSIEPVETDTTILNELFDWHASMIEVEEDYIVNFVNDLTQLPVIIGPLSLEDVLDSFDLFKKQLQTMMQKQHFEDAEIQTYLRSVDNPTVTKSISRAKLGPLSAVTSDTNVRIKELNVSEIDTAALSEELSEVPRIKDGEVSIPLENWFDAWVERSNNHTFSDFSDKFNEQWIPALNDPSQDHWSKLYDEIDQVSKVKPWESYSDYEWIAVQHPETKEWTYCTIMGNDGSFKGIGLFTGRAGLNSLYTIYDQENDLPDYLSHTKQDGIIISFLDQEEDLDQDNADRLEKMDRLQSNGSLIPEVMKHTPGFIPWGILSDEEAQWTTDVIEQLLTVLNESEGQPLPSVTSGHVMGRQQEENQWITKEHNLLEWEQIKEVKEKELFRNEIAIHRIKRAPKAKNTIVMDVAYTKSVIQEHPHERPFYPMLVIGIERSSGLVLDVKPFSNASETKQIVQKSLMDICSKGKPKEVIVRKNSIEWIIEDFCKKTNIKLKTFDRLVEVEDVMKEIHDEQI